MINEGHYKKPRICKILGVEVDEEWQFKGSNQIYKIGADGALYQRRVNCNGEAQWKGIAVTTIVRLIDVVNDNSKIVHMHHWTADDIADAKAVRRLWANAATVERLPGGAVYVPNGVADFTTVDSTTFPTLRADEIVKLDDILEAEDDG